MEYTYEFTPNYNLIADYCKTDLRKVKKSAKGYLFRTPNVEYVVFLSEHQSGEILDSDDWYREDLGISEVRITEEDDVLYIDIQDDIKKNNQTSFLSSESSHRSTGCKRQFAKPI